MVKVAEENGIKISLRRRLVKKPLEIVGVGCVPNRTEKPKNIREYRNSGKNKLRLMLAPVGGNRPFATSAAPKMKQFAENVRDSEAAQSTISSICALQQLMHAPMVVVDKSKRESMQEVDNPDVAVSSSDKFINKSFLRKVGQIQEPSSRSMPDSVQHDPFTRPRTAETLKTAGVDPSRH
ncbi:uncharacterized protein LOC125471406 [Pyrus x bretschneideri]|uniref:uncharacterized protein LOC125471406 n=1 Tax=Pyrus x bretschneideri TaxID=225117 RepID=UPI00202DE378|nr:uncharacterized protein LOC125471406 [Pyrus x bretschneideri]